MVIINSNFLTSALTFMLQSPRLSLQFISFLLRAAMWPQFVHLYCWSKRNVFTTLSWHVSNVIRQINICLKNSPGPQNNHNKNNKYGAMVPERTFLCHIIIYFYPDTQTNWLRLVKFAEYCFGAISSDGGLKSSKGIILHWWHNGGLQVLRFCFRLC